MKKIILLVIILLIIGAGGKVILDNPIIISNLFAKKPTATINNKTFSLLVAKTDEEKRIGLSKMKSLEENSGMLFPFEKPSYYSFWMKDMKFPIDIIFLRNNTIVTIHKNVQPPKTPEVSPLIYTPTEPADSVLEINAGVSEKYNIKVGDNIKIENLK